MKKRIVIAGGSGFVGRGLCRFYLARGYEVVVVTRGVRDWGEGFAAVRQVVWDGRSGGEWVAEVEGAAGVINLAGENVASGRWSAGRKRRILASRVESCAAIIEAVQQCKVKPAVVVQASAIGYYGDRGDEVVDESGEMGQGFLAEVVRQWEAAIEPVRDLGVRLAVLRLGVVLGRGGGMLAAVMKAFRLFVGGHPGSGLQQMSWVHLDDVAGAIEYCLANDSCEGVFNLTAPGAVTAKEFFATLGKMMRRPSWLHVPGFVLKILLGQMAEEMVLTGQRVAPRRLMESGFEFQYPQLPKALVEILSTDFTD